MEDLLEAVSMALNLSRPIGCPKLIASLETLVGLVTACHKVPSDHPQHYVGFGVPLAYTWDSRSTELKCVLSRMLVLAFLTGNIDVIRAARTVEDHFLVLSERVQYVELVCRRKLEWT